VGSDGKLIWTSYCTSEETGRANSDGSGFDTVYGSGHFRIVFLPPIEMFREAFNEMERFMKKKTQKEAPERVATDRCTPSLGSATTSETRL